MYKLRKMLAVLLALCMISATGAGAAYNNPADSAAQTLGEYQNMLDELNAQYGVDLQLVEQPDESVEELREQLLYFIQRAQAAEEVIDDATMVDPGEAVMPLLITRAGEVTNTYLKVRFNATMDDTMTTFKGGVVTSVVGRSSKIAFNLSSSSFNAIGDKKSAQIGIIGVLFLSGVQYNGYKDYFTVTKAQLL